MHAWRALHLKVIAHPGATHFQSALHLSEQNHFVKDALYFALIENRSFLISKNSGSQFNRSIATNLPIFSGKAQP
jgi:hypothetical protein